MQHQLAMGPASEKGFLFLHLGFGAGTSFSTGSLGVFLVMVLIIISINYCMNIYKCWDRWKNEGASYT